MLHLRRSTAAVLLVGAAVLAAPVPAVAASSAAVPAAAQAWTYYASYPDLVSCETEGPINPYGAQWQCLANTAGGYDLYVYI
jgi:hypothetical protein